MGAWALTLFIYFIIWSFSRNTAMSSSTGSTASIPTTSVSPSTDGNELSVCPKLASIPVVGMCRGDSLDGRSLYLDASLYSDQFTECSCYIAVSAGNGSVDIYPTASETKNCDTKISIADLRYSLNCESQSQTNHATATLNSSYALRVDITGHGVGRYCLHIKTNDENVTIQLNCLSGVVVGNNMTSLTTSTASAQTTQLVPSSLQTSLTPSASTSTLTSPSPSTSPLPSTSPSTSIFTYLMYSTSTATSSSSTKAHTRASARATGTVETSSPTSSVSVTSSAKTTQKASPSTSLSLTNAPETTASVLVTTKETSKKPSSTPSSEPSAPVTVPSLTTLTPATSESTPSSDNNTPPDANSPGFSFPVLWVAVSLISGILLILVITGTVLFCRFRHQKTYDTEEEGMTSIAASIVSPEGSMTHIQMLNPIYCDDPEMKTLSNYETRPRDDVSNVSSFISEEPSSSDLSLKYADPELNSDPSLKDADPELNQVQTELMQTLVTKPERDCSKRMTYCPSGGRKGSTQGLYRL